MRFTRPWTAFGPVLTAAAVTLALVAAAGTASGTAPAQPQGVSATSANVWTQAPTGFAALPGYGRDGTTGGADGRSVVVRDQESLTRYAEADQPYVIHVVGTVDIEPSGHMIRVGSDKTIIGAGIGAEITGGGFYLNEVENVIIRNLTFRDSYVPGDWDGDLPDNDNDAIRVDTSHHVWIDHCEFRRAGDGLLDLRKDSDHLTLSWNIIADHNKTLGIGWTDNATTKITLHHNLFQNTHQRNPSIDNTEAAHLYNNYFRNIAQYAIMSRGAAKVFAENNHFSSVVDPLVVKDPDSELVHRGNTFDGTWGRIETAGEAFDPESYYEYHADPAEVVPALVSRHAGPKRNAGTRMPATVTVALDASGDYASLNAALGAIPADNSRPVTIVVQPGHYREVVRVWPGMGQVTLRGATGDPDDVVISYDFGAEQERFYGGVHGLDGSPTLSVYTDDATLADLTVENTYDGGGPAVALRTLGERTNLNNVSIVGEHVTE